MCTCARPTTINSNPIDRNRKGFVLAKEFIEYNAKFDLVSGGLMLFKEAVNKALGGADVELE